MKHHRCSYLIGALCVVLLPWLLLTLSKGVQSHLLEHHKNLELFMNAVFTEENLEEEVLFARSYMLSNYDSLAETSSKARELCKTMEISLGETSQPTHAMVTAHSAFCEKMEIKLAAIERFKIKNAVIQNSLRFLPLALLKLSKSPEGIELHELYTGLLSYSLNSDSLALARTETQLRRLAGKRLSSKENQSFTDDLLSHTRVVLQALKERHEFERIALSEDVLHSLIQYRNAYLEGYERNDNEAQAFRVSLLVLTFVFAALIFALFVRLQSTQDKLTALNHSLEKRVSNRTKDLTAALQQVEQKQEQLMHASRLSALGEMAGGIAHEINSPLAAISLHAELIESTLPPDSKLLMPVQSINATVARISKIVRGLRRFARGGQVGEKINVTVGEIVADTLSFCGERMRNSFVELRWDQQGGGQFVHCQPEQLTQVLLNLINNSVDAVSAAEEKWIRVSSETVGTKVRIYVEDSGPPIDPAIRQKMLQPFFTTKPIGKGTGLGLSISRTIMHMHEGTLSLDGSQEQTRFIIEMPI